MKSSIEVCSANEQERVMVENELAMYEKKRKLRGAEAGESIVRQTVTVSDIAAFEPDTENIVAQPVKVVESVQADAGTEVALSDSVWLRWKGIEA